MLSILVKKSTTQVHFTHYYFKWLKYEGTNTNISISSTLIWNFGTFPIWASCYLSKT